MAIAAGAEVEVVLRGVELVGGPGHVKPSALWWTGKVDGMLHRNTVAQFVTFIEHDGSTVVVDHEGRRLEVAVTAADRVGTKSLQARADGRWTGDLLTLPTM
ncbi:hypothetical protein [uncultured Friedmanniella sp.]|uniref:hypothetical protein n=1 Tax=uncultured Friedmanniella sp. TaxID=335381 RepID=UPI0035C9A327